MNFSSQTPPWQPLPPGQIQAPSYMYPSYPVSDLDDEIDLLEIVKQLWKGRWIIVGVTSISILLSIMYALSQAPSYKAEVLLSPVSSEATQGAGAQLAAQYGGLASVMGIDLGGKGKGSVDAYLAILKSRKFIHRFIEEKNLLPVLFEGNWDARQNRWLGSAPSAARAYEQVSRSMKISKDIKTGLITLTMFSGNPEQAASWANQLVASLNSHIRKEAQGEAQKSIHYLESQIQKTSWVEIREILYRLIEKEIQSLTLSDAREEFAFSVIDPAVVPENRESPKRKQIVMVGSLMGFVAGVFMVFVLHFIQKQVPPQKLEAFDFTKGLRKRFKLKKEEETNV